jgi:serine/threonine protein kinase
MYIITEFVRNGTLEVRINKNSEPLHMTDVRKYFMGLIYAIEYCHECALVMHRDIKLENILLDEHD